MKKIIGILFFAVLVFTLSSCEIETSQNGDLDGFWHLEQVDTLATGGTCSFADKRIFWGCQRYIVQVNLLVAPACTIFFGRNLAEVYRLGLYTNWSLGFML